MIGSGSWLQAIACAAALVASAAEARGDGPSLVRTVADAEVDWAAGTITARGGAAADFRMPSAAIARPGAERRARATAVAKLRAALTAVMGPGKLSAAQQDAALARVGTASIDYQSNGGVLLSLALAFADVVPAAEATRRPDAGVESVRKTPEQALSVAAMPFELSPRVVAGEREAALPWAVYRAGTPPAGVQALAVRRDSKGRLLLPKGASLQKVAGAPAVIYVQKITK